MCTQNDRCTLGGDCIGDVRLDGGTCGDDGNACTEQVCLAGKCTTVGLPVPIVDEGCNRPACDPVFGRWKPAGTACLDNNADNGTESCDAWGHCSVHSVNVVSCKKAPWCFTTPGKPPDLHCWLNANVRLGNAISFSLDGYGIWEHYSYWQWAQSSQQELQQAFENAWNWVAAGIATPFAGPPLPDPLVNQHILGDNDPMQTYVDKDTAWKWYVASVGHSLALEIAGIVPWSMCRYSGEALQSLISGGNLSPVTPDGTYHLDDSVLSTPAHPVEMYRFLLQNSLLGPTPVSTIANTVEWSTQLYHANNGLTAKTAWDTWQYRGAPPCRGLSVERWRPTCRSLASNTGRWGA